MNPTDEMYYELIEKPEEKWRLSYIESLLEAGADINLGLEDGLTFVAVAAGGGRLDIVKALVEAGADVNPIVEDGDYPLSNAARQGFQEIFDYLAPLTAPEERRLATMDLPGGIKSRARAEERRDDFTKAAGKAYLEFIQDLLVRRVDVNTIGENGCTVLWTAAHNGHLESIRTLIQAGADVNIKNRIDGWSPLMIAALTHQAWSDGTLEAWGEDRSKQIEVVRLLIEAGADVNVTDDKGNTVLFLAKQARNDEIIQILLEAGAIEE